MTSYFMTRPLSLISIQNCFFHNLTRNVSKILSFRIKNTRNVSTDNLASFNYNSQVISTEQLINYLPDKYFKSTSSKSLLNSFNSNANQISKRNYSTKEDIKEFKISWKNKQLQIYIKKFKTKHEKLKISSTKSIGQLQNSIDIIAEAEIIHQELLELKKLSTEEDEELSQMAKEDIEKTSDKLQILTQQLLDSLMELQLKFPTRGRGVILELCTGVGGQEAMLFTNELWCMYQNYAYNNGWNFSVLEYATTDIGGLRQGSALVQHPSDDVFSLLQYEGGIHRVQRVPKTERTGRIHTSTAAVAVLLQPNEVDVVINPKDLKIDTMRASGAGGQNVQKTQSAVRVTHLPSGIVTECQTGRSQHLNKNEAMQKLRALLYQKDLELQTKSITANRKLQVGSRSRSEKIRTYNVPQDRVTDHRINFTSHNVSGVLGGGPQCRQILENIKEFSEREAVVSLLHSDP